MVIRSPKDFWAGLLFVGLGILAVWVGSRYPLGTAARMGPGYFPRTLGLLLMFLGAIIAFRGVRWDGEAIPKWRWRPTLVVLGSVVDMRTVRRVNELIDDALAKGAKLVCGGKADNTLMPATLLDNVTAAMRIYSEETFAPVKAIVRVDGEEAAIACANDNAFGLSAAVFTADTARGWRVAQRIESGICHINGPTVHDEAQMPFGGVKASGWGRFGGRAGIEAFTDLRWITVQTTARHYPF